jgi:hypothetical protein
VHSRCTNRRRARSERPGTQSPQDR